MSGDNLKMNFIVGHVDPDGSFVTVKHTIWRAHKSDLFGATGTNVTLVRDGTLSPIVGPGLVGKGLICIPYAIRGETYSRYGLELQQGPFDNGVIVSIDGGATWKKEHISSSYSVFPAVRATDDYLYYTAGNYVAEELWYSRRLRAGGAWSSVSVISRSCAVSGLEESYHTVEAGDTFHVCWLDRRHEKKRLNPLNPRRGNYEVVYCHRNDEAADWTAEVILSKGLLYAYQPAIAAEGKKVVVVWAGVESDRDGHGEFWPNDIFYVTSKDGGDTWTEPLKVTDGFKDGITSGRPQVALLNGVIHLFYIQGKINYKEVSAGVALLNQPPWPIYYIQRPFPQ